MNSVIFYIERLNYTKMFNFANKLVRNEDDARDLVQNAILKSLEKNESFQDSNFEAWFKTILYHDFVNRYRHLAKFKPTSILFANQESVFRPDDAKDTYKTIMDDKFLSRKKGFLFFRLYVEGYSYRSLARKYNLPIGTVKSAIFGVRRLVRKKYSNIR